MSILFLCQNDGHTQTSSQYSDTFFMIVDVQDQFYSNNQLSAPGKEMVEIINLMIDSFDPQKVIYIKAAGKKLSLSFKGISVDTLPAPGLDPGLKLVSHNFFTKREGDAFSTDKLIQFLQENNARKIIVAGMLAEKCVYQTVMGGKQRGYVMKVVPEAVIGKSEKSKQKVIQKMREQGIAVLSLKDIL
jgi:nicotinamidase-related amidase